MGRARGKPTGQSSTQWQADLHFDSSLGGGWRWRQLNSEVAPLKKSVRQPGQADPKTGIRPTDVSWTGALRPSGAPSTAVLGSLVRPEGNNGTLFSHRSPSTAVLGSLVRPGKLGGRPQGGGIIKVFRVWGGALSAGRAAPLRPGIRSRIAIFLACLGPPSRTVSE
jgi:hypothetical protein